MQEWVDTLRLKLREMKILSPKENLYSKLPEVRPPLLPTRDPTRDPLPLIPPVPAAIVPGVIVNTTQTSRTAVVATVAASSSSSSASSSAAHSTETSTSEAAASPANADGNERIVSSRRISPPSVRNIIEQSANNGAEANSSFVVVDTPTATTTAPLASTSMIKMLYPLPNFSHQTNDLNASVSDGESDSSFVLENQSIESTLNMANAASVTTTATVEERIDGQNFDDSVHSLARTFAANVLFDPNASSSKRSQHVTTISNGPQSMDARSNDLADDTISVDSSVYGIYPTPEPLVIPR